MNKSSLKVVSKTVVLAALFLSMACANSKNAALEQARTSFENANADPTVVKNAPVEMHDAEQYLTQAERAHDAAEVEQYAYLAEQKVKTARNASDIKSAQTEQETMKDQRSDILLSARDREVAAAKLKTKEAESNSADATGRANDAEDRANNATSRADLAEQKSLNLQNRLNDVQSKTTARGLEFTLQGMLFEFNKSELKPGGQRLLGKLAMVINENPERQVLIEGHTDSLGTENYNLTLSQQRAEAVKSYLSNAGIAESRMSVKGYGKEYPVAPNTTEAGRQQNRRVEVVLLNQGTTSEQMKH